MIPMEEAAIAPLLRSPLDGELKLFRSIIVMKLLRKIRSSNLLDWADFTIRSRSVGFAISHINLSNFSDCNYFS
jgi:hypothetical protein